MVISFWSSPSLRLVKLHKYSYQQSMVPLMHMTFNVKHSEILECLNHIHSIGDDSTLPTNYLQTFYIVTEHFLSSNLKKLTFENSVLVTSRTLSHTRF